MKKKKLLTLVGSICLSLVLAALLLPACAPAAPEEVAEEIAELEDELAASEKEVKDLKGDVSDLEKEIAALRKPAEVQEWEPATWQSAGTTWDDLAYMCDLVNNMSDGRLVLTPSASGAICPVDEQLDAVIRGTTEAMMIGVSYYAGKIPIEMLHETGLFPIETIAELLNLFEMREGGRVIEIFKEEYAKYGDVHLVGHHYRKGPSPIYSNVPLYGVDDLKGVSFRSADLCAEQLASLGAGTVWCPGDEIYTMLATGVVDAVTYDDAATALAMSWHEVTKYWIKKPLYPGTTCDSFMVNSDVWGGLADDLKAIVKGALDASWGRGVQTAVIANDKAWKWAEDYGIEMIEWSDEDCVVWNEAIRALFDEYRDDPACNEFLDILARYMVELGRWE